MTQTDHLPTAARITRIVVRQTALLGVVVGLCVAIVMTAIDWHANPGGVFSGETVTNWAAIAETAWSWFWPVTALAVVITAPVVFLLARRRIRD